MKKMNEKKKKEKKQFGSNHAELPHTHYLERKRILR